MNNIHSIQRMRNSQTAKARTVHGTICGHGQPEIVPDQGVPEGYSGIYNKKGAQYEQEQVCRGKSGNDSEKAAEKADNG